MVDPVPLADAAWKELLGLAPLRAILLTNGNHVRDTVALRDKRHQVPVVTAPDTRRDITELRPDVTLLPNELLYGITAIAIPGATPGETAFYSKTGVHDPRRRGHQHEHGGRPRISARQILRRCQTKPRIAPQAA